MGAGSYGVFWPSPPQSRTPATLEVLREGHPEWGLEGILEAGRSAGRRVEEVEEGGETEELGVSVTGQVGADGAWGWR